MTHETVGIEVGRVVHYYRRIGVAAVELHNMLDRGDRIYIHGHTTSFGQKAESLERDHTPVVFGRPGHVIGIKVNRRVRRGDRVYATEQFRSDKHVTGLILLGNKGVGAIDTRVESYLARDSIRLRHVKRLLNNAPDLQDVDPLLREDTYRLWLEQVRSACRS
jgi:hypothetical protein